jgi:6-phosphogluconolactonase (cycloisomerase 2 family)
LFCYVLNQGAASVNQYSRNASTGLLTALVPATVASTISYNAVISADGTAVYANGLTNNSISQFNRNTVTGALTAMTPATVACSGAPASSVQYGNILYVFGYTGGNIVAFNIDPVTKALTQLYDIPYGLADASISIPAISPDSTHMYAGSATAVNVFQLGVSRGATVVAPTAPVYALASKFGVSAQGSPALNPVVAQLAGSAKFSQKGFAVQPAGSATPTLKVSPQFWS